MEMVQIVISVERRRPMGCKVGCKFHRIGWSRICTATKKKKKKKKASFGVELWLRGIVRLAKVVSFLTTIWRDKLEMEFS